MGQAWVLDVGQCSPDHAEIRALLETHFAVRVERAALPAEARQRLAARRYRLILVNPVIYADKSDGLTLLTELLADRRRRGAACMLVSSQPELQARAQAAGAAGGFAKAALADPATRAHLAAYLPPRSPEEHAAAVRRLYRWQARFYDATRRLILPCRRRAVAKLALRPDSRVLELGCGTGLNFCHLLGRLDAAAGGRLVGVDFSPEMLARARRRVARHGWPHVRLVASDAAAFELPERFDAVLLAYSLTLIADWRAALQRAAAHLEREGRVVVLDFGRFERWGPAGTVLRGWLRLHHVDPLRPYVEELRRLFGQLELEHWLGGYCFIAAGQQPVEANP